MGAPKPPTPPPLPPPPLAAHPASFGSASAALAGALEQQRSSAAEGKGMDKTVLTSPEGLTAPTTARAKLG